MERSRRLTRQSASFAAPLETERPTGHTSIYIPGSPRPAPVGPSYAHSPSSAGAAAAAHLLTQSTPSLVNNIVPATSNHGVGIGGPSSSSAYGTYGAHGSYGAHGARGSMSEAQAQYIAANLAFTRQNLPVLPAVWTGVEGSPGEVVAPPRPIGSAAGEPTVPQAMYTTFPARMKAGTTGLVQPILQPISRGDDSPRRTRRVKYTEAESEDSPTDEDNLPNAPGALGTPGTPGGLGGTIPGTHSQGMVRETWLGRPPPASRMVAKRVYKNTNHVYWPDEEVGKQAERPEVLIPIKIELETDQWRIRDCFVWNMNEKLISPYHFAKLMLEDLDLPVEPFAAQIQTSILQQVQEAIGVADLVIGSESESRQTIESNDLTDREDDLRVVVDYEVQILRCMLRDRFEWDLCSSLTPESFAIGLCQDLGITGEAKNLISCSIREQLMNHKRAVLELGLVGYAKQLVDKQLEIEQAWKDLQNEKSKKRGLEDDFLEQDIRTVRGLIPDEIRFTATQRLNNASNSLRDLMSKGPRPLEGVWRDWYESREFGPLLETLTEQELEKLEESNVRSSRRNRREAQRTTTTVTRRRR